MVSAPVVCVHGGSDARETVAAIGAHDALGGFVWKMFLCGFGSGISSFSPVQHPKKRWLGSVLAHQRYTSAPPGLGCLIDINHQKT